MLRDYFVRLFLAYVLATSTCCISNARETLSTRDLQLCLIWLGHLNAEAGKVGAREFEQAVQGFQRANALPETGILKAHEVTILREKSATIAKRYGFQMVLDESTGVRIGLPTKLFADVFPRPSKRGSEWNLEHRLVLDTLRIPLGRREDGVIDGVADVRTFFKNLLNMKDLKRKTFPSVGELPIGTETFTLEGLKAGASGERKFHFHVRADGREIRAFAFSYPAEQRSEYEPLANVMASTFDAFPVREPTVAQQVGPAGPLVSPAFAAPRPKSNVASFAARANPETSTPAIAPDIKVIRPRPASGAGIALVVGNGKYAHEESLRNPERDAADIADRLRSLGFRTELVVNLPRFEFEAKVVEFVKGLRDNAAEIGLFFYAGHGLQVAGTNYLLPTDAKIESLSDVKTNGVSLDFILERMESRSRKTVMLLDACRDSPWTMRRLRNLSSNRNVAERATVYGTGLAPVAAGLETYIAYSTRPGQVAQDGNGRNSPFAGALLRHLSNASAMLPDIMMPVRRDVLAATNNEQMPWEENGLSDRIQLKRLAVQ